MKKVELLREIEEILELNTGDLNLKTELAGLSEWDSINILTIIAMIQTKFDKSLTIEDLHTIRTAGDLVSLLDLETCE